MLSVKLAVSFLRCLGLSGSVSSVVVSAPCLLSILTDVLVGIMLRALHCMEAMQQSISYYAIAQPGAHVLLQSPLVVRWVSMKPLGISGQGCSGGSGLFSLQMWVLNRVLQSVQPYMLQFMMGGCRQEWYLCRCL